MSQTLLDKIGEDFVGAIYRFNTETLFATIRARQLKKYDWCAYIVACVAEDFPNEATWRKSESEQFVKEHMSGRRINIVRDSHGHVIFAETRKELIKKIRKELPGQFMTCVFRWPPT